MSKVFLGGTCNGSKWRNRIVHMLDIDYFNPVVDDWTEDCMDEELRQRDICDFCLYTITPLMTGVYSIAEVVDDSNKRPEKTVFVVLTSDGTFHETFSDGQIKSLKSVSRMVVKNGGKFFESLKSAAVWLNEQG